MAGSGRFGKKGGKGGPGRPGGGGRGPGKGRPGAGKARPGAAKGRQGPAQGRGGPRQEGKGRSSANERTSRHESRPARGTAPEATESKPKSKWYAPLPKKARETRPPLPTTHDGTHRSGFALLFGKPNVGKSTLMNRLVGEHIAAVSPKPQTTRTRILGVVTRPDVQVGLLDVPGVHDARSLINQAMVEAATGAIEDADVVLYLAEAGWPGGRKGFDPTTVDPVGSTHRSLLVTLERTRKPVILVLTKVDLLPRPQLLPLITAWQQAFAFKEIYPLSGLTGENLDGFVDMLRPYLPEGPALFPDDTLTDQSERALCSELIREQVFLQTRDEVPYGAAVEIDKFDETARGTEAAAAGEAESDADESDLDDEDGDDDESSTWSEEAEAQYQRALKAGEDPLEAMQRLLASQGAEIDDDEGDEADDGDEGADDGDEAEPPAVATPVEADPSVPASGDAPSKPRPAGLVKISATIIVERDAHKGIVIGKGGSRLKEIGRASRERMETLLGARVFLELFVKVIPGWTEKRRLLHELGLAGGRA